MVVVRPSHRRVLKASQALPLQALHLAYEAGPSATYDMPAWASGRPSRVVVSSAAGLIIMVTDGEGGVLIEREAGCATAGRHMDTPGMETISIHGYTYSLSSSIGYCTYVLQKYCSFRALACNTAIQVSCNTAFGRVSESIRVSMYRPARQG